MRHFIYILIVTICFYSCKPVVSNPTIFNTKDFIIIDTASEADLFLEFTTQYVDYPIYYIGAKQDSIKIGKRFWRGSTEWKNNFDIPQSRSYSEKVLDIFVDTTVKTNSPVEYYSDTRQTVIDSVFNYHSFLLVVKNIADSAIVLGHSFSLVLIGREAKNKNGEWIKIGKKLCELGTCGAGDPSIILKPGELVISKVKRYKGPVVTDFRLAFGYDNNIVYSNTFRDSIDERTLENAVK